MAKQRYSLWYSEEVFQLFKLIANGKNTVELIKKATGKTDATISEQLAPMAGTILKIEKQGKTKKYEIDYNGLIPLLGVYLFTKRIPEIGIALTDIDGLDKKLLLKSMNNTKKKAENFSEFFFITALWHLLKQKEKMQYGLDLKTMQARLQIVEAMLQKKGKV